MFLRLIRAEWVYRWEYLSTLYLVEAVAVVLALSYLGLDARTPALLLILVYAAFFSGLGGERTRLATHADRRDRLLPIPARQAALTRLLFPLSTWVATALVMLAVLALWRLSGRPEQGLLGANHWVSMNGLMAVIVGSGRCLTDLRSWSDSSASRKVLWAFWKVLVAGSIVPFVFLTSAAIDAKPQDKPVWDVLAFIESIQGMVILNGVGLLLLALGYVLYQRKPNHSNP